MLREVIKARNNGRMTKLQSVQLRQSETRERINELLGIEERTDDQTTELRELTKTAQTLEVEYRAALAAEKPVEIDGNGQAVDPEVRERLELRSRATFGGYLVAALQGRIPAGAEAEYASACSVAPGEVPLDLFEQDRPAVETRQREQRADAATPLPSSGAGATLAPIQPFVFAPSIAPRLGIEMPSVGSGAYSTMTIGTALTAAAKAKGGTQESTAAALTAATAKPRRISARLTLRVEDIAEIGQSNFEAALRENARMALSDEYDEQCISGDGQAPNVSGLTKQLTDPANPTTVADFDAFVAAFADSIDGLWSSMISDVSIVANVDAYKLSAKKFRDRVIDTGQRGGVSLGDVSAADYLREHTGGWWTNKRMPATASNIARGIVYRRGRAGLRTAVHPTWGTLAIDDIYTDSASGQRHFTLSVLVGDKVLLVQPAAYGLVEFKVA